MPRARSRPLAARAQPVVRRLVGDGSRSRVFDVALARLPTQLRPAASTSGLTASEFLARRKQPPGAPAAPRAGSAAVRRVNALSGALPAEAVLLARTITDTAPRAGQPVHPTLRSVLDNYLPESLRAYAASRSRGPDPAAEQLLLAQLRLLHQVAREVSRADEDHVDLRIQDAFLRERFAALSPSALRLTDPPSTDWLPAGDAPAPSSGAAPNPSADAEDTPVVRFAGRHAAGKLTVRLALPRGHPATLGVVVQGLDGVVRFRHTRSRRWAGPRRSTGFPTAQADLSLPVELAGVRRLLVFARSPARGAPTECVLFVRAATAARTALPTLLANSWGAEVTAVCSGYAGADGLVLRNESLLFPDLRSACTAFGYDTVTWLDADTPLM